MPQLRDVRSHAFGPWLQVAPKASVSDSTLAAETCCGQAGVGGVSQ